MTNETQPGIPERIAPVQGYSAGIPWSMHLRAYDTYCKKYGEQKALIDLEGRNCRGGFSVDELDVFIPGWREELSEIGRLKSECARLEAESAALKLAYGLNLELHGCGGENCTEQALLKEANDMLQENYNQKFELATLRAQLLESGRITDEALKQREMLERMKSAIEVLPWDARRPQLDAFLKLINEALASRAPATSEEKP